MAIYAIGDVQGCFSALQKLLDQICFDPAKDRLWFVGDLVNRGPNSLSVLRYVRGLGASAVTVLGNHDLHLLAVAAGCAPGRTKDTFQDVLTAPDCDELLRWLRHQHLLYQEKGVVLVHAGLLPQWTVLQAVELSREVEEVLRSAEYQEFLRLHYKNDYSQWSDDLTGMTRLSVITNALTKLRVCSPQGDMALSFTGPLEAVPNGLFPWFQVPERKNSGATIICGHWAALGLHMKDNVIALDGGCVYGRQLVAVHLDDRQVFQVSCPQ
ncbi:MAG TPA: symmetrical bis(5'-nucleosyl)-tetraphosphatase [Nitrospiraceae bacterium]|nr:symmetrical bis(5'-nucleosyl)-tetraphosphatase [Nitrospiraceae bacterium]